MQDETYSSRLNWASKHRKEAELPVRKLSEILSDRAQLLLPAEGMFPDHSDWPSYSEEVKQWTCSSASCWLLKWPNTQSSIEKSSLEGNTTTQKWNLLAVNKNRTNRGAGIVSHGNSNERELDMQERKLHNINFPSHSMYSPVSLYTVLGDEHKKAEGASEWMWVSLPLACLHFPNTAALLLITAH